MPRKSCEREVDQSLAKIVGIPGARKALLRSDLIGIVRCNIFVHPQQSAENCPLCSNKLQIRIRRAEAIHDGLAACKERCNMFPKARNRLALPTLMISVSVQKIYRG